MKFVKSEIGKIALEIKTGKTPPTKDILNFDGGDYNWYTPGDFKVLKNLNKSLRKITQYAAKNNAAIYKKKTVLITCIGDIGNVGIIDEESSANQQITGVFVDSKKILPEFFLYWVKAHKKLIEFKSNRAVVPILNNATLRRIPISYPSSIQTQQQIVAVLDKAQSLIQKREQSLALLDELLRATFLDMFGDPVVNEKGLKISKLSDLGLWKSGGTPLRSIDSYFQGDIPWFSSGELNNMYIYKSKEKITKIAIEKTSAKLIESGSLLVGMYDTAALKSSITKINASCNQAIAFSKLNEKKCTPTFVYFAIQIGREFHLSKRRGVRQRNLNLSMIKALEIPLPSLNKQKYFSSIVSKIEGQRELVQKSLEEANNLFQSLLLDTFNGSLKLQNERVKLQTALEKIKWFDEQMKQITGNTAFDKLQRKLDQFSKLSEPFRQFTKLQEQLNKFKIPNLDKITQFQKNLEKLNTPELKHIKSFDEFNRLKENNFLKKVGESKAFKIKSFEEFIEAEKEKEIEEQLKQENDPVLLFIGKEQIGHFTVDNYKINVARAIHKIFNKREFDLDSLITALKDEEGVINVSKIAVRKDLFRIFREFIKAKHYDLFSFENMRQSMRKNLFNPSFELLREFIDTELKNGLTQKYVKELHKDPSDPYYNDKSSFEKNRTFQLSEERIYLQYKIEADED